MSAPPPEFQSPEKRRSWLRRLYHWTLGWAHKPHGTAALFIIAFAESSFFPIPPDILLIALCVGHPEKALRKAFVCKRARIRLFHNLSWCGTEK